MSRVARRKDGGSRMAAGAKKSRPVTAQASPSPRQEPQRAAPAPPRSIHETGLTPGFLLDLLVKTMYRMGLERPTSIARAMKLPAGLVIELIEMGQARQLIETRGQVGANLTAEMRYALTGAGREWALEALAQNEWFGPAPVTLAAFSDQIINQSIRHETLTRATLDKVFSELTLPKELMEKLGPAANSGASMLLYGPPGNGKSSIAEAICAAFSGWVYFPHAGVVDKQSITVFDPTVHTRVADDEEDDEDDPDALRRDTTHDRRYVPCRRPAHRRRAGARPARPGAQQGQPHLRGADAAQGRRRRAGDRRLRAPARGPAGADQPPDHPARERPRLPGARDRSQIRDPVRRAGGVLDQPAP